MIDTTNWTYEQRLNYLQNCTPEQWEAICKQCGICCLEKVGFKDVKTGYLSVICEHFDVKTKKCMSYNTRLSNDINCGKVTMQTIIEADLLPASCGYSEFLFGQVRAPCVPAKIDYTKLKRIPESELKKMSNTELRKYLIPESIHWNLKLVTKIR